MPAVDGHFSGFGDKYITFILRFEITSEYFCLPANLYYKSRRMCITEPNVHIKTNGGRDDMKNRFKRLISVVLCLTLILSISSLAFAKTNGQQKVKDFKDVRPGHWAYDAIMWMLERNIIDGVGGNRFEPDGIVTRAQFAKMMVNTLGLKLFQPETPSFLDVDKKSWAYPYVESAKPYLTGFKTASGHYFKPNLTAVREDMAVALVNAMGYNKDTVDESILDQFEDKNQISPNLRKHVAISVKYGLIKGTTKNGRLLFDPQGNLTRAQAAVLLRRAFEQQEEKVTYDEEKVTYDPDTGYTYERPIAELRKENNTLVLRWNKIALDKFREYRVVISKSDDTPQYPENGYLYRITDRDRTYAIIDNSEKYNGGDFGNYLTKGQTYHISVTAVYSDRNVPGNTITFTYDGNENPERFVAPVVSSSVENGKLVLRWNKIDSPELRGYVVSASKNDSSVSYPENGYLYTISDANRNYAVIDNSAEYKNGDFNGYFINGEQYYFSVTAVYRDKTVAGNTIRCTYVGEDSPVLFPAPEVSTAYEDGRLVVKWNKLNSPLLTEYRVVISKNKENPVYPADGYYDKAYDKDTTSVVLDSNTRYHNGEFRRLIYGTEYYISVTAVYGNKTVAGNAVKVLYLADEQQGEQQGE
jgi:hypothetical protein